jgi:hypothetical protein
MVVVVTAAVAAAADMMQYTLVWLFVVLTDG